MNEFTNNMDMLFEGFLREDKKQVIYKVLNDYNKILFDMLKKCMKEFNRGLSSMRNKLSVSITTLTNSINKGYRYAKKFILKSNDRNIQESKDVKVYIKRGEQLFEANMLEEKSSYFNNVDDPSKIILGQPFNTNVPLDVILKSNDQNMDKMNSQFNKIENEVLNENANSLIIDEENHQILNESLAVIGSVMNVVTNGIFMIGNGIVAFFHMIPFLIKSLKLLLIVSVLFFIITTLGVLGASAIGAIGTAGATLVLPFFELLPWLILIPTSLIVPTIIYKIIKLRNEKSEKWIDNLKYIQQNDIDMKDKDDDVELNQNENISSSNNGLKIVDSSIKNEIENDPDVRNLKNDIDKYRDQIKTNRDIDNKIKQLF